MNVTVPPEFGKHDFKDKLTLRAGSSAALELPFTASPQPEVTWKWKGGRMPDLRRFKEDTIESMTSLTMAKVTKADAGEYSVTIENKHGKATFTIKLSVLGKYNLAMIIPVTL